MDSRPLVYLGTISYSTYLYHLLAGGLVTKAAIDAPSAILTVASVAATYVAASISYHAVESPFLRLRGHIERRFRGSRESRA